jgi:hypothetical protein
MSESILLTRADCQASLSASTWSMLVATMTSGRSPTVIFPFVNRYAYILVALVVSAATGPSLACAAEKSQAVTYQSAGSPADGAPAILLRQARLSR